MNQYTSFLQTVPPFNLLPAEKLEAISNAIQEIEYNKDTLIYKQEVTAMKGVDIIAEGAYESFFYDSQQNKRLVELHDKGYCYGGVSVLLNRRQSLRTVMALKGTKVYFLPRKEFKQPGSSLKNQ